MFVSCLSFGLHHSSSNSCVYLSLSHTHTLSYRGPSSAHPIPHSTSCKWHARTGQSGATHTTTPTHPRHPQLPSRIYATSTPSYLPDVLITFRDMSPCPDARSMYSAHRGMRCNGIHARAGRCSTDSSARGAVGTSARRRGYRH